MLWIRGETLGRGGFAFVSNGITKAKPDKNKKKMAARVLIFHTFSLSNLQNHRSPSLLSKRRSCSIGSTIVRSSSDVSGTIQPKKMARSCTISFSSGGCLTDIVKSCGGKGLPEPVVRNHTRSILVALSHIHKLGYVHCDIKPHNILIVKEGDEEKNVKSFVNETAKLADLGSAIDMHGGDNEDDGGFRGTVLYAAPESITHQTYVPQSDVWSLGCTILYMFTGRSPWKFDNPTTAADLIILSINSRF